VQDLGDVRVGERRPQGREVLHRERVHQDGFAAVGGDLDEADFLEVVVEAVRFGVQADGPTALEGTSELGEGFGGSDPARHAREYTESPVLERLAVGGAGL
jgi:hypothetical protein